MQGGIVDKFVRSGVHNVVPGNHVTRAVGAIKGNAFGAHEQAAPKIELIRDGDVVQAIDVTCSCGETIRLWCSYEPETASAGEV